MKGNETIVAIASAVGIGAIVVIRVSGDRALEVGDQVLKRPISGQDPNKILMNKVIDGEELVDIVMAVFYKAPNSYTGEDMIELYCHGGTYVSGRILDLLIDKGIRLARPGEFTMRAVLNNKMDLIQAEAVLDLVEAKSGEVARVAVRNMQGNLSIIIIDLSKQITDLLVQIEGTLDFPEDEDWFGIDRMKDCIIKIRDKIERILAEGEEGVMIREGPLVVITGRKNVGKSTLFNKLLGIERAIVTPKAGTTRDYLVEDLKIGQHFIRLVDTAGLGGYVDVVEEEGMRRARDFIDRSDLLILTLDRSEAEIEDDRYHLQTTRDKKRIVVLNKSDLPKRIRLEGDIDVSAKNGEGIDRLKKLLVQRIFQVKTGSNLILRKRQLDALINAKRYVESALNQNYLETISSDLRNSLESLGELTGRITNEEILDRIFSEFCIGK